jgi:glycosyltransferase involved in cell wall biosynthesis
MESMALAVAAGLQHRGHTVAVTVSRWNNGEFARRLQAEKIPYKLLALGKISRSLKPRALWWTVDALLHLPGARRQLRRQLHTEAPDIVIVYNRDWLIQSRSLLPQQRTLFHVQELSSPTPFIRRVFTSLDSSVGAYICISRFVGNEIQALGIHPDKIRVVYNGVSVAPEQDAPSRSVPTVGIVGQIGEWKGHEVLLGAIGILHEKGVSFHCMVFGDGDRAYIDSLKSKAKALGLEEAISWRGYQSDADAIYREIDICVVPSQFAEPFGLVAVEAGLRAIPVIASRRGGLPEIIDDGHTGFLVTADNVSELAMRLEALLRDSSLRSSLGRQARQRVLQFFTTDKMVDQIERICKEVLELRTNDKCHEK